MSVVACVDIGSTYTKAALVDVATGALLATAQAPTTLDDVVTGVLAATAGFPDAPVVACSSAGGGLRLAVVGYEELISAEAGHRAALSAGARVVHVAAGRLDDAALAALAAAGARRRPARRAAPTAARRRCCGTTRPRSRGRRRPVPVVLAGNAAVRDEVAAVLRDGGLPVHRGRQRAARHRPARAGVGAGGDPGGLPRARHRRRPALHRSAAAAVGAGGDARTRCSRA